MEALVHATWLSTARSPDVMRVFTVDYWCYCMERMEGLVIFNFVQCHFVYESIIISECVLHVMNI